ncbi:DUF3343 domain-containing protein [Budviciaceae bacterium CWB-B4]|uniref:DUF3343 domain-containing protein n=1 Tax=Limnobaculum xujianqingii TaxID=2738837 RepID=A0A9D7AHF1_9GAMM|nr:DUF3343 domain-containing protein [Limnobaculum xujianqingii]MBK5072786.1 DUF3343 domain-containing protein [Limnobaculum xujianqingii]MBK5176095.1 DUF3343 domain-containing protein [Limnobaculum xujianqingii]
MNNEYLFLFHTPLGVIQLKKKLNDWDIHFLIIDAPRTLSAECGMAVRFELTERYQYSTLINSQVKSVYQITAEGYDILWQDQQ